MENKQKYRYTAKLTPMKAIRAKCLDCCCGQWLEVKLCPKESCALWEYRFGKKPKVALGVEDDDGADEESVG